MSDKKLKRKISMPTGYLGPQEEVVGGYHIDDVRFVDEEDETKEESQTPFVSEGGFFGSQDKKEDLKKKYPEGVKSVKSWKQLDDYLDVQSPTSAYDSPQVKDFFLKESEQASIYNKNKDLEYLNKEILNLEKVVASMQKRLEDLKSRESSSEYQRWLKFAPPEALYRKDSEIEQEKIDIARFLKKISELNKKRKMLIDEIEQLQANEREVGMSHPKDEEWDF